MLALARRDFTRTEYGHKECRERLLRSVEEHNRWFLADLAQYRAAPP